jgi:hypothetical protein
VSGLVASGAFLFGNSEIKTFHRIRKFNMDVTKSVRGCGHGKGMATCSCGDGNKLSCSLRKGNFESS